MTSAHLKSFPLLAFAVFGLALALAPPALAQDSGIVPPEKIAEHRAEQAQPRKPVTLDPAQFDKFAGYYMLGPDVVFTIHRDDAHFLTRLTGQTDVEFYPESDTKFFAATLVPAQISFDVDASGKTTGLVLHQGGLEQPAPRIDEAAAKKIEADLADRIRNHTPSPGTEAALRASLESIQGGKPDLSTMTPSLASITNAQLPVFVPQIQSLGPIKSITFKSVGPGGMDIYDVAFTNGDWEWRIGPLNAQGKIGAMGGRPVP
jgi:hypothetical protein